MFTTFTKNNNNEKYQRNNEKKHHSRGHTWHAFSGPGILTSIIETLKIWSATFYLDSYFSHKWSIRMQYKWSRMQLYVNSCLDDNFPIFHSIVWRESFWSIFGSGTLRNGQHLKLSHKRTSWTYWTHSKRQNKQNKKMEEGE